MEFLLKRFKDLLQSYGYTFHLEKKLSHNKEYILNFSNLPADLDFKLLELCLSHSETVQDGQKIYMKTIEIPIFKPFKSDNKNYLYTTLTEKNYAEIINKIDVALREHAMRK